MGAHALEPGGTCVTDEGHPWRKRACRRDGPETVPAMSSQSDANEPMRGTHAVPGTPWGEKAGDAHALTSGSDGRSRPPARAASTASG